MVDERFVPLFSKESNARMVRDCFSEVMSESNMHFFDPKKETVKEYYKSLKEYGGRFDIVVLSAGEDDHIASLFAGHPESSRSCFIEIRDAPKPPKKRMSASRKLLLASPYAHLLFMGDKKKHALSMFFDETVHEEEAPAKLVYRMKHTFVYSDVKV